MRWFEDKIQRPFQSCSYELCQAGTFKGSVELILAPGFKRESFFSSSSSQFQVHFSTFLVIT
jgi:hypothetical protein